MVWHVIWLLHDVVCVCVCVDKEAAELFECDHGEPEGGDSEAAANHRRGRRREHQAEERAICCG